jgi:hypothetical protein
MAIVLAACGAPPAPVATTTTCASCHAGETDEWRASKHRASFTDSVFQASLARERPEDRAFCIDCHRPNASHADDGIGCASCHGSAPHEAKKVVACASCHQFTFAGRDELVQKTADENARSAWSGVACASCHRGHRFQPSHSTIAVDAHREADALRFTVRADAVGHAFPTGDMFRRVRLVAFAEDSSGTILAAAERTFGREWGAGPGPAHARTQLQDTRINGATSGELRFEATGQLGRIARIRWELVYERVLTADGVVVEAVVIARGVS